MSARPKIVVLGMMTKMPVPGVVWQTVHYLVGFERLGYETYYVEAHARTPSMFMETEHDDGSGKAAAFVDQICRRFGLAGRWCYQALHEDGRCYGLSRNELDRLYGSAELILNMHGGTQPLPEHSASGRLVYLETDPVQLQTELHHGLEETADFLEPHCAFFTFAANYGRADCRLPVSSRFEFRPTRQPVVLDYWEPPRPGDAFTTIGNWKQPWREVTFEGEEYSWSKHHEWAKVVDLPTRVSERFRVALAGCEGEEKAWLEQQGWEVDDPLEVCGDIDSYRDWIWGSKAEFTVAKDQNVRLRTGWFSDRSATYLAAGRPVVTQDTGFGAAIPEGEGLFAYVSTDEAAAAIDEINAAYDRHAQAAREIGREYFDASVVLGRMLETIGSQPPRSRKLSGDTPLIPRSRRPLELPEDTVRAALALEPRPVAPRASVVLVTYGEAVPTRLCLESVLVNTDEPTYEIVVVDNGSDAAARVYLQALVDANPHIHVLLNEENAGFARAVNQGLAHARGELLVIMNNDVVVPPRWLRRLARHLRDESVGLVGPVTNRSGNEAEVSTAYRTYGEFLAAARARAHEHRGQTTEIPTLTMFCVALRRDAYERLGPLDEQFGRGLLEDDDYSRRARDAAYRLVCAEDVLVHHFGEASFGALVPTGEYNRLLDENKKRFEEKWGEPWSPYARRPDPEYERVKRRVRELVRDTVPEDAVVAVASRGDDSLLDLDGRSAVHFPKERNGSYSGHHPADSAEAIAELQRLRSEGVSHVVFPKSSLWWLDHYSGLRPYLDQGRGRVAHDDDCAVFAL